MRKIVITLAVLLCAAGMTLLAGCSSEDEPGDVSYLVIQNADGGTLEHVSGEDYILTLTGVSDIVSVFADRPIREAHVAHTGDFIAAFGEAFGDVPPNAALNFVPAEGGTQVVVAVLEITAPDYDPAARTLSYDATVIPVEDKVEGITSDDTLLSSLPSEFGHASLFIDSTDVQITYINNSGNTDNPTIFVFTKNLVPTFDVLEDG